MPKSNKKIVVFHSDGCPACHEYLPVFKKVARKYQDKIAIKSVNLATTRNGVEIADKYKIKNIPTTIILDGDDQDLLKTEGAIDEKAITRIFEKALR